MQDQSYIDDSIEMANNDDIPQDVVDSDGEQQDLWDYEENSQSNPRR